MQEVFIQKIIQTTNAIEITETEVIQNLWSGYGQIIRCHLRGGDFKSVVVKFIDLEAAKTHPKGWNTPLSHERKIRSYENEISWYSHSNNKLPSDCKTPKCLASFSVGQQTLLILADVDTLGYSVRKEALNPSETKVVLTWLAQFHAFHMDVPKNNLWETGSYWHLATRPDEFKAIENKAVQTAAPLIDQQLRNANYQTVIHGDAKLANFCFPKSPIHSVVGLDFQYTGMGVGVSDVIYFLGSSITEPELEKWGNALLDHYFDSLSVAIRKYHPQINEMEVAIEWRSLYSYAWADFTRFLLGWMPSHHKLNSYSMRIMDRVLTDLNIKN